MNDPLQGVVTADNCANRSGPKGPQRAVTAETPVARLRQQLNWRIREARRCKRVAQRGAYGSVVEYWEGNIVALVKLRRWFDSELRKTGVGGNGALKGEGDAQ